MAISIVFLLLLPNFSSAINYSIANIVPSNIKEAKYWVKELPNNFNEQLKRLDTKEKEEIRNNLNEILLSLKELTPNISTNLNLKH